jgi:hypothetical protein
MGCHHPSSFLNTCVNELTTDPTPVKFIDHSVAEPTDSKHCDRQSHCSVDKMATTLASSKSLQDTHEHDSHEIQDIQETKSDSSSIHSSELCDQKINYREHAERIFYIINDMRYKPQKYLNKLNKFAKKYNKNTKTIELIDTEHFTIHVKADIDPQKIIEYLEKAPSIGPILWSEKDFIKIYEDNEIDNMNIVEDDVLFTIPKGIRMESDFILQSAEYTLFMILLQNKNNIQKIFSENVTEGIVICFKLKNKTMIYLLEN